MRCSHCQFENESGYYRCQKCGNSLLPPLPREIYMTPPPAMHDRSTLRMRRLAFSSLCLVLGMGIGFVAMLVMVSARAFMDTPEAQVYAEEVPYEAVETPGTDLDDFFVIDPQETTMVLPGSNIVIGLPEYTDVSSTLDTEKQRVVHRFLLKDGLIMEISCCSMDYPFSKSAEEDYFMDMFEYEALEGQEDQYFIIESCANGTKATVVDRLDHNYFEITIEAVDIATSEQMAQSRTDMKEIVVGRSSLTDVM